MTNLKRGGGIYIAVILLGIAAIISSRNLYYKRGQEREDKLNLPQKAVVIRVIDGDTIVIEGGYRVRYIGINTPETRHPKKAVEYFGKEASEFNKILVMGKRVDLEYDVQRFDKYGRLLAYVYVEDIFVNAKLVEEGYAQAFTMPPNIKYAQLFLDLQRMAKAQNKGLWSESVDEIE